MYKTKKNFIITIIFLVICAIISSFLIYIANNQFLDNAQVMGEEIVNNLVSLEEKSYISKYQELLKSISEEINSSNSLNIEKTNNIYDRFKQITSLSKVNMYIVKNNEIYEYNDEVKKSNINYAETQWYKTAIEANGEMKVTNVYEDETTKERIVSFVLKANEKNDVISVNLYIDAINSWTDIENLPEGARYYVCDSQGNIIHAEIGDLSEEQINDKIYNLYKNIKNGQYENSNTYLTDESGEKRGVYYKETSTQWTFIITIPYDYLLRGIDKISMAYYGAIAIFVVLIIYLIIAERNSEKKNSLYNRITKALGDSYYALYLIDLEKGTYSMLKASEHVREAIPQTGEYTVFLDCIETLMEKDVYKDFKETFSISNIQSLVDKNVKQFGGDFKRIFSDHTRWVNVKMLYNEKEGKEVVLAFQDINEEKERDLERNQIIQDSIVSTEEAVKSKNKFFANMSHDMRTPLNAIINFSEMAKEQLDNKEKLNSYIEKINISSKQLLELINDILDISKMEEGMDKNLNKEKFNITQNLKDTISIFEEEAKIQNKKFQVIYNIKNNHVIGDWGKIRPIINNLLANAFKYTLQGGNIVAEINEIEGKFVSKYEILIADDGIGMSKEFLEKIYTPFARETRFYSGEIKGTGLGMVIVHANVQRLNGQIEIKSEPGKGSTFKVTIPLEISDSTEETKVEEKLINLAGKRILIAEDNELNMEISEEVLGMQGIIVEKAMNGQEAVDKFKQSAEGYYDAILMDMQMPVKDGCEATKEIRKLPRKDAKIIPIIAVTANTFADDIVNTRKAGMDDFITKPIDFKELQKTLSNYLKNRR